jgi:hypothetical protein
MARLIESMIGALLDHWHGRRAARSAGEPRGRQIARARRSSQFGTRTAREGAMTMASDGRRAGLFGGLVRWWRNSRAERMGVDELENAPAT